MNNENNGYPVEDEEENILTKIDVKKLLSDVIRYWWVFVLSVGVVFVVLKVYHNYKTKIYAAEATVIVDNSTKSSWRRTILEGVDLGQSMSNFDNQLAILGSRTLISRVVEKMGVYVSYYHIGRIKDTELFRSKDFVLIMDSTHVQPIGVKVHIKPNDDNTIKVSVKSENIRTYCYSERKSGPEMSNIVFEDEFKLGEPIITPWCAFTIMAEEPIKDSFYVVFNEPQSLIARYSSALSISTETKTESTVVTLKTSGANQQKCEVFLNTLINTYVNDNLRQKTEMSENTIRFIDSQLVLLSDSLDLVSSQLSNFRSHNQIQDDLTKKGDDLFDEVKGYETELKQLKLEGAYYGYLEKYFSNDSIMKGDIAPATFKTERPIITELLKRILDLNSKRQVYRDTYGREGNPMFDALNAEFNIVRNTLLTSIKSHKEMVAENISDIEDKISEFTREIMTLPETERTLLGIDRKFKVTNDLYTFLLQKRAEAQIQRASSTPDHKPLDSARTTGVVSPNIKRNQTLGFTAAIFLPLLILVLRQLLDSKIRTSNDVKKLTKLPVIGEIPNNTKETSFVVQEYPRSVTSEEFRRMRIKLDFLSKKKTPTIIAVTSSMPGDGKTFCALNTASVFAIAKKKTVLMGFDLRKPGLSKVTGLINHMGITDYLIGNCQLDDIISESGNLHIIGSGTVPPNPSELIQSDECRKMMELIKERYDYIVLDTPPISLVSDALQLTEIADVTMFVVRQDYTEKQAVDYSLECLKESNAKNVAIIVNDINSRKTRYGYGYGNYGSYGKYGRYGKYGSYGKYGYGYGNKYGYEEVGYEEN